MWPPTAFFRSSSFAKRLPVRCSFIFGNRKKSDDARSGLYGGCSKMSRWNCSSSKAFVCRAICGRATEQFHPKISTACENRITPRTSLCGILNRHSHDHSYLWTYHVTRSDVQLHGAIFKITLNTRNLMGCNKTGAWTVYATVLYFLDGPCIWIRVFFSILNLY